VIVSRQNPIQAGREGMISVGSQEIKDGKPTGDSFREHALENMRVANMKTDEET
jgi:hypothetical protein